MARKSSKSILNKFLTVITVGGIGFVAYDFLINKPGSRWIPLIDMFDERTEDGRFVLGQWHTLISNITSGKQSIEDALGPYFKGVSDRISSPSILTNPIFGSDDEWANILSFGSGNANVKEASAQKEKEDDDDNKKKGKVPIPTAKDLDKMIADAITGTFKPYPTTQQQIRDRLKNATRVYNSKELESELSKLIGRTIREGKEIPSPAPQQKPFNPLGDFSYWLQKSLGF